MSFAIQVKFISETTAANINISMYFGIFAAQIEKESNDIDELGESRFVAFAEIPHDSENEIRLNTVEMANTSKENPSVDSNQ